MVDRGGGGGGAGDGLVLTGYDVTTIQTWYGVKY